MKIAKQKEAINEVTTKKVETVDLQDDVFIFGGEPPTETTDAPFSEKGLYTDEDLSIIGLAGGYSLVEFMQVSSDDTWVFDFQTDNANAIMKYNDVMQYTNEQAHMMDDWLNTGMALDEAVYMMDSVQDAVADNGVLVVAPAEYFDTVNDHSIVFVDAPTSEFLF